MENMKIREAILAGVIFLSVTSCTPVRQSYTHPEGPRYMGQFAEAIPEFDGQFKVVTYNIKLGKKLEQAIQTKFCKFSSLSCISPRLRLLQIICSLRNAFICPNFAEPSHQMKKAIELDPYNLNYTRNLGRIFYFEGSYEDAMSVLQGTIDINPVFTIVNLSLALLHLQQSEYEEALDAVKKEEDAQGKWNPVLDCIS